MNRAIPATLEQEVEYLRDQVEEMSQKHMEKSEALQTLIVKCINLLEVYQTTPNIFIQEAMMDLDKTVKYMEEHHDC